MLQEIYITKIADVKDIKVFDVVEIDLDSLSESFHCWCRSNERWAIYEDYINVFPQAHLLFINPNIYKITFEFYGYNELVESVTYELSISSVKYILNNLINNQNYKHRL